MLRSASCAWSGRAHRPSESEGGRRTGSRLAGGFRAARRSPLARAFRLVRRFRPARRFHLAGLDVALAAATDVAWRLDVTLLDLARPLDPHPPRLATARLRDHDRLAGGQRLHLVRVHDEALDLTPRPAAGVVAAEPPAGDLAGLLPHPFGARYLGDRPCRLGHLLTVDDLERRHADDLIAQATGGPIEIGQLLGRDQDRHPRLATSGQQADQMVGAQGRELIDADGGLGEGAAGAGVAEPISRGRDEILHDQGAELGGEPAVSARVQAEQHHLGAAQGLAQVDRPPVGVRRQVGRRVRLGQHGESRLEPARRAQLVGRHSGQVVQHPGAEIRIERRQGARQAMRIHQRNHLGEHRRAAGMRRGEHVQNDLDVALGGALVVRLGETLGRHQLVLELGGVAVLEGIPVRRTVDAPAGEWASRAGGGLGQHAREGRRALHVDGHHRQPACDLLGEDPEQRGRLAGATGAQDEAVSRELRIGEQHPPAASIDAERDCSAAPGRGTRPAGGDAAHKTPAIRDDRGGERHGDAPGRRRQHERDECERQPVVLPAPGAHRVASGSRPSRPGAVRVSARPRGARTARPAAVRVSARPAAVRVTARPAAAAGLDTVDRTRWM